MIQQGEATILVVDGPAGQLDMLASDADRDDVVGMLSSAFAEGRLSAAEHADRVRAAYGARTHGELNALTADLPGSAGVGAMEPGLETDVAAQRCLLEWSLLVALLICCPPAGIAWLLAGWWRSRAGGGPGAADR